MSKLIYHKVEPREREFSPIDSAILEVANAASVRIACPYLGRDVINRITGAAADWKLITDIDELLRTQSLRNRDWFASFIREHLRQIRHCSNLHAKVILSPTKALIGSANFTEMGTTKRHEMSVMIDDQDRLAELSVWYDSIWSRCDVLQEEQVDKSAALARNAPPVEKSTTSILPPGPQVHALLSQTGLPKIGRWTEDAFLARVAEKYPDLREQHEDLIVKLKEKELVDFRGDGKHEATYHVVLPSSRKSVFWVYENGSIYGQWGKLSGAAVAQFQLMLGDHIETFHPDGKEKNDGCFLAGGIRKVSPQFIIDKIEELDSFISHQDG